MEDLNEEVSSFAEKIDIFIECDDIKSLICFRDKLNETISTECNISETERSALTYYLANIFQHLGLKSNDRWDNSNYGNAIICHRKFYKYEAKASELLPQVEVNHANTLSTLGRTFEAIPLWKKALLILGMPKKLGFIDLQMVYFGFLTFYMMKSIFITTSYMHTTM
ncbi:hypothetical protein [Aeromonas caviae]|uniref:hypothetical protein n=1 Tax=Aeromonas caviae TaxID=648 RepID=UPI002B467DE8|nr:hypothetical protein [Aeromonas caviae]